MSKEKKEQIEQDSENRLYEVGYLIVPTTAEEAVPAKVDAIRGSIESAGGVIVSEGAAEFMHLAYEMAHEADRKRMRFDTAYFGWMRFNANPEGAIAIKKALDASDDIIRFLVIKIDEDKIKSSTAPAASSVIKEANGTEETPEKDNVSDAELDEAIKELVA